MWQGCLRKNNRVSPVWLLAFNPDIAGIMAICCICICCQVSQRLGKKPCYRRSYALSGSACKSSYFIFQKAFFLGCDWCVVHFFIPLKCYYSAVTHFIYKSFRFP